ncbi:MAG: DevR family CRISPR-associated autoregulator [Deltaproteobacteria bacterium]|nr:DevR family CRISPR-associated autoregulator [Deltaproteobacteria bacterium]
MKIYTLSICGRLTLDLHNLNNEGTEGNQQLTRMVSVVVQSNGMPAIRTVNAISGDMFKHIQAEHLHRLALEEHGKDASAFPLSNGAKVFDANRINSRGDQTFFSDFGSKDNVEGLSAVLRTCAVTDLEGTLITAEGRSLPRKSCIEFGWVVGVPDLTRSDTLFHVKYDPRGRGEGAGAEENIGQAIFHRPLNSGVYAVVAHVEVFRVGRNDITVEYVIDAAQRLLRSKALLLSAWYTFVKTSGAQRNTQHPHVLGFEGAVAMSGRLSVPAPTASPLADGYLNELDGTAQALNRLSPEAIGVKRFATQAEFGGAMADIIQGLEVPN